MAKKLDLVNIRLVKEQSFYSDKLLNHPDRVVELMAAEMSQYDREVLAVVNLTTKMRPINICYVSTGTVNASLFSPKEILKSSILSNAANIMLLHNHPSGDPTPSQEDIKVTKTIATCASLMDIKLLDHIIIGGSSGKTFSFTIENLISEMDMSHYLKPIKQQKERTSDKKSVGEQLGKVAEPSQPVTR